MHFSDESLYKIALSLVPRVGARMGKQLISYCGSAEAVFHTPPGRLRKIPGLGAELCRTIHEFPAKQKAEDIWQDACKHGAEVLFYTDPGYPRRLRDVHDAPLVLFRKGTANLNQQKVLSIVGTRYATEYGKEMVRSLVREIKDWNPLIVSGLAYGIDIEAHKAALEEGLDTVAVFGCGLDRVYPAVHRGVVQQMLSASGAVMSEYLFGTLPETHHFPTRNRIIAGLADAVIVAEATHKGGALITAEIAESYYRDVFALPGNAGRQSSEGCNNLIKHHKAQLLTGGQDLAYFMNWNQEETALVQKTEDPVSSRTDLSASETELLQKLREAGDLVLDELAWRSGVPVNQLSSLLLQLEMKGLVKALPGSKFRCRI